MNLLDIKDFTPETYKPETWFSCDQCKVEFSKAEDQCFFYRNELKTLCASCRDDLTEREFYVEERYVESWPYLKDACDECDKGLTPGHEIYRHHDGTTVCSMRCAELFVGEHNFRQAKKIRIRLDPMDHVKAKKEARLYDTGAREDINSWAARTIPVLDRDIIRASMRAYTHLVAFEGE